MSDEKTLRQSLLDTEPLSAERQQRFREDLSQIVEPRLPRSSRLYYRMFLLCIVIGIAGEVCGLLFDTQHRGLAAMVLPVSIAAGLWVTHILRRGAEPVGTMQGMSKALAGIGAFVAVFLVVYGLQNPSLIAVLWSLLGVLFCLLTSAMNLWNRTIIAERMTREHILRVEYRLADLASRLAGDLQTTRARP